MNHENTDAEQKRPDTKGQILQDSIYMEIQFTETRKWTNGHQGLEEGRRDGSV